MMGEQLKNLLGQERTCAVCRKGFIIHPGWVYKKGLGDRTNVFCSWKCLRVFEKRQLKPADRRLAIEKMVAEGKTIREIADELGCDTRSVYYWVKKFEEEVSHERETGGQDGSETH